MWSPAALHFLFNTLTAIQAYVRSRPGLAEEMIGALAQLVRATLSRGEGPVLVAEELALVQMYLGLERARLGHRLRTVLDVDPGTLGVRIPALVMQPLVENAVVHAAACRVDGATLRLAVRYRHERKQLLIMVADDGPGVPRPRVAMEGAGPPVFAGGLHLGLSTLRRRLAALYGRNARLRLLRRPGGGTIAAVALPTGAAPRQMYVVPQDAARADRRR